MSRRYLPSPTASAPPRPGYRSRQRWLCAALRAAGAAAIASSALALALISAPAHAAPALIQSVQLVAQPYGQLGPRVVQQPLCAGEVVEVTVNTQHPTQPGAFVGVSIDGYLGSVRYVELAGDPGPRRITILAGVPGGPQETRTEVVEVDSCSTDALPTIDDRINPYHRDTVDLRTTVFGTYAGDFNHYFWNFGDGEEAVTTEAAVSHFYGDSMPGTTPYQSFVVTLSNLPFVNGQPASGALYRRHTVTLMDDYYFSKQKGILQPPATTSGVMENRGSQLTGSYRIRNVEAEPIVYRHAIRELMSCDLAAGSRRDQVLPTEILFQGGYGRDLDDPELQTDPRFIAAMALRKSLPSVPEDALVVPPHASTYDPDQQGASGKSLSQLGLRESGSRGTGTRAANSPAGSAPANSTMGAAKKGSKTVVAPLPPIPPPPSGPTSGVLVLPANHVHAGLLNVPLADLDPTDCVVAYHLRGETPSGGQVYTSLYFEARPNPALENLVKDKTTLIFLEELLSRGLVPDPHHITDEDIDRLQQEGKVRRTPAGWEVL
ncbi:MAG: hypothetical protein AAGD01_19230 [Acidobacteriota bacterium]